MLQSNGKKIRLRDRVFHQCQNDGGLTCMLSSDKYNKKFVFLVGDICWQKSRAVEPCSSKNAQSAGHESCPPIGNGDIGI